jgi:hypothetical protein
MSIAAPEMEKAVTPTLNYLNALANSFCLMAYQTSAKQFWAALLLPANDEALTRPAHQLELRIGAQLRHELGMRQLGRRRSRRRRDRGAGGCFGSLMRRSYPCRCA